MSSTSRLGFRARFAGTILSLLALACHVPRTDVYCHGQKLDECKCGEPLPGPWWHGRGWVHIGERRGLSVNWRMFSRQNKQFTLSLLIGDGDAEDGLLLHVEVPILGSVFVGCEGFIPSQCRLIAGNWVDFRRFYQLRYDLSYGSWGSLWWNVGTPPDSWDRKTPRWRDGSFDPADFVLGRPVHSMEPVGEEHLARVHMLEARYTVTVQMERATWRRPRWPFPRVKMYADVKCEGGMPIPGKGENSWDCDDDAIEAMSVQVSTPEEGLAAFVNRVRELRERRGGLNWKPRRTEETEEVAA